MLQKMICATTLGAAVLLATATTAHAGDILIDSFTDATDDTWPVFVFDTDPLFIEETNLSGVLGGTRQTSVSNIDLEIPGLDFARLSVFPSNGLFDYSSSVGASMLVDLTYQNFGDGQDWSDQIGISVDFVNFDFADGQLLPVTVLLYDGNDNGSVSSTLSLTSSGAQSVFFSFGDFSNIDDFDLSSVLGISVQFDAAPGVDFRLGSITTVIPAPGAIALLGIAGLIGTRRRRNA